MHSARVSSGQKKPPLLRGGGWTLEYLSFSYYLPELLLLFFRLWGCVVCLPVEAVLSPLVLASSVPATAAISLRST
jgi:hypothetical protein